MSPKKGSALLDGSNLIFFCALGLLLFGLYSYLSGSAPVAAPTSNPVNSSGTLVASTQNAAASLSPLDKIIAEIDSGYYGSPRYRASQTYRLTDADQQSNVPIDARVAANWDAVISANYARVLQESKEKAEELLKTSAREQFAVRSALASQIKGIEFVLSKPEQSLTAPEAMAYIDHLHLKVAEGMSEDGVDRSKRRAWDRFAARVRLTGANVVNAIKEHQSKEDQNQKVIVSDVAVTPGTAVLSVSGLVKGIDVDRVLVYWNGAYYASAQVRPGKSDSALFHFQAQDGRGDFRIKAIDKNGFSVSREYRFFN